MSSQFSIIVDGDWFIVKLFSLDEYEAEGGIYFDGGNGGGFATIDDDEAERLGPIWHPDGEVNSRLTELARERAQHQFKAALDVTEADGSPLSMFRALEAVLGLTTAWYDSVAGYYLIRDWPADAPLAARFLA